MDESPLFVCLEVGVDNFELLTKKIKDVLKLEKISSLKKNFDIISEESIAICGLLHDLCKIDFYKVEMRNVKENGEWVQKPYYSVDEKLPYGHGEKSVYIINGFIRLTREEALAINWHMGGFDSRFQGGGGNGLSESFRRFPLSVWLHVADLTSTYIDENSLLKK